MLLKEYMYRTGLTYRKICSDLGLTSRANLCRVANGRTPAGKKLACMIEEYTKGSVTRDEILFPHKYEEFEKLKNMVLPNKPRQEEMKCKSI